MRPLAFLDEEKGIPAVFAAESGQDYRSLSALLRGNRKEWDALACRHGGILFRGFGVDTVSKFEAFIGAATTDSIPYVNGNSPRIKLGKSVYTSTEYPREYFLALHNEMSYTSPWPSYLYFCCVQPARVGGETPIADSHALIRALPREVVNTFASKGIRYIRNLPGRDGPGSSWQTVFETLDPRTVETLCARSGIEFTWKPDGTLRLIQSRPSSINHRSTGEPLWFNQADNFHPTNHPPAVRDALLEIYREEPMAMPHYVTHGDGSSIDPAMLEAVRAAAAELAVPVKWQKGDVLFLDNEKACHGRNPFEGERKLLVAMEGL
jgi:alpha-ketoglutarate-dependent taurine dioxygenase